ncbi:MAG: ATP-grasp domain-containing protein [Alkalicoccus sp.]|nr:MAG: ATP-grasp domain-containing protein [Alkalicoccus sp.]
MNRSWPPHLPEDIVRQAEGPLLCGYLIALEGWRRGLDLHFHSNRSSAFTDLPVWYTHRPGRLFTLSSGNHSVRFFRSRGDGVAPETVKSGADKAVSKAFLEKAGVPVPQGTLIRGKDELQKEADRLSGPFVLKVSKGSFGKGVITNLQTAPDLLKAFEELKKEHSGEEILLEEHVDGPEYRLYVVGEETVGAVRRDPASVTGDGKSTVRTLIEQKNSQRKKNPRLATALITVDKSLEAELQQQGLTLDSSPPGGKIVPLRKQSNVSLGGDPVDVLDAVPEEMKEMAVRTLKAFPDFPHGGVDIIHSPERGPVVLEVNPTAQIALMVFPMSGTGRDIPKAVIDYYFPETAGKQRASHAYFSLADSLMALETGAAVRSRVPDCPVKTPDGIHWLLEGPLRVKEREYIRTKAMELHLTGWLKQKASGWHLYAAGEKAEELGETALKEAGSGSRFSTGPAFITPSFAVFESREEIMRDIKELRTLIEKTAKKRRRTETILTALKSSAGLPGRLPLLLMKRRS